MDFLTLLGIGVGLAAIIGGNLLEGGHLDSLLQLTAFVIVFGGTCGAVLVQTPQIVFMHAMRRVVWIFVPPSENGSDAIKKIVRWSQMARKEGLLSLQSACDEESDSFLKSGLQMLTDGNDPDSIRAALEVEMGNHRKHGPQRGQGMGGLWRLLTDNRYHRCGNGPDPRHE